ncbi:MAG TPA: hypothetical protein VE959_38945 [Bryobacteraceae bacterium]|nr:hypothetical protein [Bryobacteraceae bacterium]
MAMMIDWAKDLLLSRGALVETEEAGSLRAILSPELAGALGSSEWLSLRFGAGAGSDDEGDWLERLGRLLPPAARVTGARLRRPKQPPVIDCAAALDRELVIQNGIYRLLDSYPAPARYYFFDFQYTIESDETSLGVRTACLNASGSLVSQAESLLNAVRGGLEEDPAFLIQRDELARLFPIALRGAQPEIRRSAATVEQSANRRLARDAQRINSYYRNLLLEIGKRIARRGGDAQAVEKERNRAAATELDRAAKLEDLARKYTLKIRVEPGDVLVAQLPMLEISARVIRKKGERMAKFHWNPALHALESPWCEGCFGRAHPLFLCDDRLHFLCKSCVAPCASCGKQFCRACQPKCRCGAAA